MPFCMNHARIPNDQWPWDRAHRPGASIEFPISARLLFYGVLNPKTLTRTYIVFRQPW